MEPNAAISANKSEIEFERSRQKTILSENIVFLIDKHEEMAKHWNVQSDLTRMDIIRDAVSKFVREKKISLMKHNFAIATFKSETEVKLVTDFTDNEDEIALGLKAIGKRDILLDLSVTKNDEIVQDECYNDINFVDEGESEKNRKKKSIDLITVLSSLCAILNLPNDSSENGKISPPDRITRCILIYGRSREIPTNSNTNLFNTDKSECFVPFIHHPYCYLDILYVHLPVSEPNVQCQEIFDVLSRLPISNPHHDEIKQTNTDPLVLETHASAIKLASHMAVLMAHPAQREEVPNLLYFFMFT